MADFDDELLEGFDDGEPVRLSEEEQDRRQIEFTEQVEKNKRIILDPKKFNRKRRIEAIHWLGEAGEPDAIEALVTVYHKDKARGVKEAATYALGQLKTFGEALEDPETEVEALETYENIVLYRRFGKRVDRAGLRRTQFLLFMSFLFLLAAGLGVNTLPEPTPPPPTPTPSPTPSPEPTQDSPELAAGAVRDYYVTVLNDANTLQVQMGRFIRQETAECAAAINDPDGYTLSSVGQQNANLVNAVELVNLANARLDPVRERFQAACAATQAIPREEAANELVPLIAQAQRELSQAAGLLQGENLELPPTATPTPIPSPTPTATTDFSLISSEVGQIETLAVDYVAGRGPVPLYISYWETMRDFNTTSFEGCLQPEPIIVNDVTVPGQLVAEFPRLQTAADNINLGLLLTRQAVGAFHQACTSGVPSGPEIEQQIQRLRTAAEAFNDALEDAAQLSN